MPEAKRGTRPRIGRYLITGRLGKGGMGMVYRGLDEKLEREVAIKTITTTGAVPEESQRRFEIEAKAAARMQHPNIVAVYELERGPRRQVHRDGAAPGHRPRRPPAVARRRSSSPRSSTSRIQVCRGLAYAHERGVFHRDIKPANIGLLEDDGTAKIMDFGIAKLEGTQLTKTGMMVGTVNYMSPEQVQGDKKLDGRTDIFSMGVILYQLLAGERPFQGDSVTQVLYKIVKEPPPPLDLSSLGEVGPRLASIVERALAKNREERYQTAKELADRPAAGPRRPPSGGGRGGPRGPRGHHRRAPEGAGRPGRRPPGGPAGDDRGVEPGARGRPAGAAHRATTQGAPGGRHEVPPEELLTQLASTFQSAPTRVEPSPELEPTVVAGEAPARSPGSPADPAGAGRGGRSPSAPWASSCCGGGGQAAPPGPIEVRIPVRSLPVGAAVWVDGRDSGVVTNDELVLPEPVPQQVELTFRKAGHRDESRTVRLPLAPGETVSVTLESAASVTPVRTTPAGATVTVDGERVAGVTPLEISLDPESDHVLGFALDGHLPREVRIVAGEVPEVVETSLEPLPPPGRLSVVSALSGRRAVARPDAWPGGAPPRRWTLASGPQVVTLSAPTVFLRRDYRVTVPAGGGHRHRGPRRGQDQHPRASRQLRGPHRRDVRRLPADPGPRRSSPGRTP